MKMAILLFVLLSHVVMHLLAPSNALDEYYDGDVDDKQADKLMSKYSFNLEGSDVSIDKREIVCFDVNQDGRIAVGYKNYWDSAQISVYRSDMTFLYALRFNIDGTYGVMWDTDKLSIYCVRSGVIFIVDDKGNVNSVKKASDSLRRYDVQNISYFANERTINGKRYFLGDLTMDSFSTLSVEQNGECSVLFERTERTKPLIIPLIIIMASVAIAFILIRIIKQKK